MQSSRTYSLPLYYFLLEILLCVLYMYLSLFWGEKTLEVGWKALVETKLLEVERGDM